MKYTIVFIILSFFSLNGRLLNVALHLDTTEKSGEGPITRECLVTICQQASPIIATGQIFYNIVRALMDDPPAGPLRPWIRSVSLTDTTWKIYKHKKSDLYLLIPQVYINKLNQEKSFTDFQKALKTYVNSLAGAQSIPAYDIFTGFRISESSNIMTPVLLTTFINAKPEEKKKILEDLRPSGDIFLNDLQELFAQGKDPVFGLWNIYIGGHGSYPKNIPIISGKAPKAILESDLYQSHALIAGLPLLKFKALLHFFTIQITTNFLYYSSCYAGDSNMILPFVSMLTNQKGNITSESAKPNFVVATGALSSIPVITQSYTSLDICIKDKKAPAPLNFALFFTLLEKYSNGTTRPVIFKDSELREILRTIIPRARSSQDPYGISALPSILFPGSDNFRALALTDKISVINNVLVHKYIQEHKPLKLIEKEAILLYPPVIPLTLEITKAKAQPPAIVSMIPGTALHKIDTLVTDMLLSQLTTSLTQASPIFDKYFYIKNLTLPGMYEQRTLHDVFIKVKEKDTFLAYSTENKNIFFAREKDLFTIMPLDEARSAKPARIDNFSHALEEYLAIDQLAKGLDSATLQKIVSAKDYLAIPSLQRSISLENMLSPSAYLRDISANLHLLASRAEQLRNR